jgi:hypothetical protein
MSYATGAATDPTDLLKKLVTFLTANGWTSDVSAAEGAGWRAALHNGAMYVHLRAAIGAEEPFSTDYNLSPAAGGGQGALYLVASTAVSTGNPFFHTSQRTGAAIVDTQTYPAVACIPLPAGAISAYHFFIDAANANVVVVCERSAGLFGNLGWGTSITKAGTFTGGMYYFGGAPGVSSASASAGHGLSLNAVCPMTQQNQGANPGDGASGWIRANVDTFTSKWISMGANSGDPANQFTGKLASSSVVPPDVGQSLTTMIAHYAKFQQRTINALNGAINLLPVRLYAHRDADGYSVIGTLPNIFSTWAVEAGGYVVAEVYSLGGDDYMLFPYFAVKKV